MNIGDKILVIDENIEGVLHGIENQEVLVKTSDGFDMKFLKSEIIVISSKSENLDLALGKGIQQAKKEKISNANKKTKRVRPKDRKLPAMEVDLHIGKLVAKTKGMTNYDMLTLQMETAKHKLDFAIKNNIQRVVFIHGNGAGVLRAELNYLFNRYDNIKFEDANYQKYGTGATEIYIFQKGNSN